MFTNKTIFITGGTGSWGTELTKQLLEKYSPKEIRIFSRGEHKQVEMRRKFKNDSRLKFFIGDVRDKNRLITTLSGVDFVFHLAALKHVPVCEDNPWEAVQTNIIGTENVIEASIQNHVKKVIDVSTDKAVDPLNLYGVSKACGEKLIIAANKSNDYTKFVCIRGGNVLGTNGSVVPLFKEQILKSNEITITSNDMTRFLMRLESAIQLVLEAAINSVGGEVFVMRMPACRIEDLAKVMIHRLGNEKTKVSIIGIRPGEKIFEVLVSRYEVPRTYEFNKYFIILPQINIPGLESYYSKKKLPPFHEKTEFNSNNTKILKQEEIEYILEKDGWFSNKEEKEPIQYLKTLDKKTLINFFKSEGWI
jgi:UDP-N-acetylglucosamine 4,6-dehydratase/5-epimerase